MKGQYRIIVEIMLILMGILITSFVISSFTTVQASVKNVSAEDGFGAVANSVIIGVLKASENNNSLVRVNIPGKISDYIYKIRLENDEISVVSLGNAVVSVKRKIFNITSPNRIITSEVVSSARTVEIVSSDGEIRIRRPSM